MSKVRKVTVKDNGEIVVTSDYGVVDNNVASVPIRGEYTIDAESVLKIMASKEKKSFFRVECDECMGAFSFHNSKIYTTDKDFDNLCTAKDESIYQMRESLYQREREFDADKTKSISKLKRMMIWLIVAMTANILAALYNILI